MSRPDSDVLPSTRPPKRSESVWTTYVPLLLPIVLFPLSTALTLFALFSLPLPHPIPTSPTAESLSLIISSIRSYSTSTTDLFPAAHVIAALSLVAIWKHSWSLPGALLLNVIAGALWGGFTATVIMTVLTAVGSIGATLLSRSLSRWIGGLMPRAVQVTRHIIESSSTSKTAVNPDATWVRLALIRLVGIVPWSGINIASGIIRIPLVDCFISSLVGCAPWTAITCHVGDILNNMGESFFQGETDMSLLDILKTPDVILKLVVLSLLCLLPILAKRAMRHVTPSPTKTSTDTKPITLHSRKTSWRSLLHFPRPGVEKVPMLPVTSNAANRQ